MPCFGSKRVEVVPCTTENGADLPGAAMGGNGAHGAAGRLEPSVSKVSPTRSERDGLHSAPNGRDIEASKGARAGVHSAPQRTPPSKGVAQEQLKPREPLGDFFIETSGDSAPNAAAVDAYLEDILGLRVVKDLRCAEWASRVQGLEALHQLVKKKAALSASQPVATGAGESSAVVGERAALFRGCITVLARLLQDKVVPVYLPALSLLATIYSFDFLTPFSSSQLPKAAIPLFTQQLVFRSGSSNVRAREESSNALLHLARCQAVGSATIAPWILKPLSNTKQAHAVVGRLELLRTLVAEFGVSAESGLEVPEVLNFTCPLCEAASGAARDAAVGLALDVRAIDPLRVDALIDNIKPSITALLKARLAPADPKTISGLSVSGRKLPPIGASHAASDTGDEVNAFAGTPPGYDARARARATASELGARGPPIASKKGGVKSKTKVVIEGDALLASSLVGNAGALSFEQSEEEKLMAEILEDTK